MSDDSASFWNAWTEVMGDGAKRLLCVWHIRENWKPKVKSLKDKDLEAMTSNELSALFLWVLLPTIFTYFIKFC